MSEDDTEPKPEKAEKVVKKAKKGTDYTAPKKNEQKSDGEYPIEKLEIVTTVKAKKEGLGAKIKNLLIAADLRTVAHYVGYEVLIPAARAMVVDSAIKGVERMFGETRQRGIGVRHSQSRVTYGGIVNRDRGNYRDEMTRPPSRGAQYPRPDHNDFIFESRDQADAVLDEMFNILNHYDVVTVGALKDLIGFPQSHTDQKFGWESLKGSEIRNISAGWLLDLPPAQPID